MHLLVTSLQKLGQSAPQSLEYLTLGLSFMHLVKGIFHQLESDEFAERGRVDHVNIRYP